MRLCALGSGDDRMSLGAAVLEKVSLLRHHKLLRARMRHVVHNNDRDHCEKQKGGFQNSTTCSVEYSKCRVKDRWCRAVGRPSLACLVFSCCATSATRRACARPRGSPDGSTPRPEIFRACHHAWQAYDRPPLLPFDGRTFWAGVPSPRGRSNGARGVHCPPPGAKRPL